jgi:Prophage protein (DUF1660)
MKVICWIFGHRTLWFMDKPSSMLVPKCKRCKQHVTKSNDGHLDPFYM